MTNDTVQAPTPAQLKELADEFRVQPERGGARRL